MKSREVGNKRRLNRPHQGGMKRVVEFEIEAGHTLAFGEFRELLNRVGRTGNGQRTRTVIGGNFNAWKLTCERLDYLGGGQHGRHAASVSHQFLTRATAID